jgi:Sugar (and other) transporter
MFLIIIIRFSVFQALGSWSFGPFGVVLIFTFLFTFIYLPETHGRSVEEIQRMVGTGDDEVWRDRM